MLTFVLVAVALATLVVGWRTGRRDVRAMVVVLAAGIPAQAVIGGLTVLTDLNPWVVSFHLLCSLALVGLAVRLLLSRRRARCPGARRQRDEAGVGDLRGRLGRALPRHRGDRLRPARRRRGLGPQRPGPTDREPAARRPGVPVRRPHRRPALRPARGRGPRAVRAVGVLLGVELAQGTVGFVQYATDLPVVLVGLHLLGAALVSACVTWALLEVRHPRPTGPSADRAGSPSRSTPAP